MSAAADPSLRKRTPLRARHVVYLVFGAIGAAYIAAPQLWAPWVYFTGGSFHALPWWSGAGSFAGPDGTYQLYVYLEPLNTGAHPSFDTALTGKGHLCTPSGKQLVLQVSGDMDKHLPRNTLGKRIQVSSFVRSRLGLSGPTIPGSPYVKLDGVWGVGRIDATGTLEHQPAAPGQPAPPAPAPITVTLQQGGEWWPPSCQTR